MNIKNRLKKIHSQVIKKDSEFCDCGEGVKFLILIPTANGDKTTLDGKPYVEPPKFCPTCGKPNREPFHCTFTINPNVELTEETL